MDNAPHHECGEHLERIERVRDFPIHGTTVPVREELFQCRECGEEEYSFEQAVAAERRAGEIYRAQNGFLQADEISALRRRWGVTQAQLESALGVGRKTVARWEAGRVLQSRALDNLLRAIDHHPAVLSFLADRQGAELHPASEWFEESRAQPRPGLSIPRTLLARLEREAGDEGVSLDVYVATVLAQGLERRSVGRELDRVNQKLDEAISHRSQWHAEALRMDDEEPWLHAHKEIQGHRGDKAIAL
jgi:putative zinc finger/helix-turn-helix YgiT family protein